MSEKIPPPQRTSDEVHEVDLTGNLIPWFDSAPIWITMGTDDAYLPTYTDEDKLRAMHPGDAFSIKEIKDGPDFLSGIPYRTPDGQRVRVIIDARRTEHGTIRFREVIRGDG